VTTFDIVGRCFLFLLLSGAGLHFILLAFIPSWRKKGPVYLETYLGSSRSKDKPTVIAEWVLNERTSARINAIVGGIFMFGGIAGIIWKWHLR
jgi:hypothetical protein